jgi:hypothetical protein
LTPEATGVKIAAMDTPRTIAPVTDTLPFDTAVARVHMGGVTAVDWTSMTVRGIYGTYRFHLADDCPYLNEAVYAFERQRSVYVFAQHGRVVEVRVLDPWGDGS